MLSHALFLQIIMQKKLGKLQIIIISVYDHNMKHTNMELIKILKFFQSIEEGIAISRICVYKQIS